MYVIEVGSWKAFGVSNLYFSKVNKEKPLGVELTTSPLGKGLRLPLTKRFFVSACAGSEIPTMFYSQKAVFIARLGDHSLNFARLHASHTWKLLSE